MTITLRPFGDQDYDAVTAINNMLYPDHRLSADEWRRLDLRFDETHYTRRRYVATDGTTQQAVGYGITSHLPMLFHPQKHWLHIMVRPDRQRRNIGSLLFERLLRDVNALDMTTLWTEVREDRKDALAFAQKRGFSEARRSWELRLPMAGLDLAPLLPLEQRAAAQSIVITTLAAERARDTGCLGRLYTLAGDVSADVPWPVQTLPARFEDFVRWLDYPGTLGEGFFIAKWGDEYIGFSAMSRTEGEPETLYINLTGVRRESRRRGAALALKLATLRYAQRHGYKTMVTRNDSANAGMIALNLRVGFRYHAGWVVLTAERDRKTS